MWTRSPWEPRSDQFSLRLGSAKSGCGRAWVSFFQLESVCHVGALPLVLQSWRVMLVVLLMASKLSTATVVRPSAPR